MKLFFTLIGCLILIGLHAQERFVARITNPKPDALIEFLKTGYDIAAFVPDKYIDLVVTQQGYQALQAKGYSPFITQTEKQLKENMVAGKALAGYRTYSDLYTELLNIQAAHPSICKLYDIGDSRGKQYTASAYDNYKHDIWALKVSDNVNVEEDEPCIFYMAEHHAREPISLEVAMYILNYIVGNYGTDPSVTSSVNNKQIWFIPLVNPNGHKIVTDENDVWWRKNIRDNNGNNLIDAGTTDGVDLNRNYGWEWGGASTSSDPSNILYCGPNGFSEPELIAVKNFLDQHHFVAGIGYHSYSELVLYPYGYLTDAYAPDNTCLQTLAVNMANTIPAYGGGYYTPEKSSTLYPASGILDDWAYGEHGIFSYTIELATEFIPPSNEVAGICSNNLQAALILLNRIDKSTVTGLVRDANTLQPLEAEVYVNGIDNTGQYRKPFVSDSVYGRYYRMLPDGSNSITFSCYGYISQTFSDVIITNTGQTILNVNLVPSQTVTVTGTVTDQATGLPITGATIKALNTPLPNVSTNAQGQYTISTITVGSHDFQVSKAGYSTIIQTVNVTTVNTVFDYQLQVSTAWSFELGVFETQWTFGGNLPWTITTEAPYEGLYCSRSGAIGDNQTSEMSIELYLTSAGVMSFARKVSSESGYDYLKFYIDNVLQNQWSGILAWAEVSFPVTSGLHTFKWIYSKDANTIGGSDRAWVDYIIFPPTAPIPDPPDISVAPIHFNVTVVQGGSLNDLLVISNNGEQDLTYTATVVYASGGGSPATVYPLNANYNTGTTTSSAKTQTSLVNGYPTTQAGWMKFDISGIPDGATINSVEFHGYVNATNYPYWNINPVTADPVTAAPSVLYADIIAESSSGYYLYRSESSTYGTGWKVHTLGGNVNANLQAALSQNWFAIGIMDRDNSASYYIGFDGWNETNKPYLVISYTYTPPYTWLKVDGSTSVSGTVAPVNSKDVSVSFEAGSLPVGTYNANIKITSNDPMKPQVMVPCTLNVVSGKYLNLSLLLEGLYDPATGLMNQAKDEYGAHYAAGIADQVTVELHDASVYSNILYSQNHVNLGTNGNTATLAIPGTFSGSYYITVRHRNSIETATAGPVSFTGSTISYNFTTSVTKAYGGNQKLNPDGSAAIYGGDVNEDGIIDSGDLNLVDNASTAITLGYVPEDVNGDGIVDSGDMNVTDNNSTAIVISLVP
jgi:carboxypeptidase T